jgi:hypothetical protein
MAYYQFFTFLNQAAKFLNFVHISGPFFVSFYGVQRQGLHSFETGEWRHSGFVKS